MRFLRNVTFIFIVLSIFTGCLKTDRKDLQNVSLDRAEQCFSTVWPHEKSDLLPYPGVKYGRLTNGLRYVIMKNNTPEDRVALHLDFQVGSIYEDDDERGYAHYLEHMLFNGSTHFPPGTLVEYFQELGMEFGADTNAHTSYDETVYKIILPKNDIEELKKGFLVLSDYAQEALLLEKEVERERGVILAEKLARDSVSYRMRVASNEYSLNGTILPLRQPIGVEETLKTANSSSLRKFYKKWYIPEKTIVVVVGDVEIDAVEPLLEEYFGNFKGSQKHSGCPDIGRIKSNGLRTFYYHEKDLGNVQVALRSYWNETEGNDSISSQIKQLKEYAAVSILKNRLEKIAEKEVGLFSSPRVYSGNQLGKIGYAAISVSTSDNNWEKSLVVIENTLRQMLKFGITDNELKRIKKELIAYFDSQVATYTTRKSTTLAREIVWHVNNNKVFQSPENEKELYTPVIELLSKEDLDKALKNIWKHKDRLIEVMGNVQLEAETAQSYIRDVYLDAKKAKISSYASTEEKVFPYETVKKQVTDPIEHVYLKDIDADIYKFSNGVTVNLKKTEFAKNKISMNIDFGSGKQSEPMIGISMLAESVVDSSGSGKLTESEIEGAMAGTSLDYDFSISQSAFSLSGSSLSSESELLIDSLYTLFNDPGIREDVFLNKKLKYKQYYESITSNIRGADSLFVNNFLSGSHKLLSRATWDEIDEIEFDDIKQWLLPFFNNAAPEITVVGDFNKEEVLQIISSSFGALGPREQYLVVNEPALFPFGQTKEITINSELDQALLVMAWKTEGFTDIHKIRRLNMLALILEDRIRLAIREKLGASYSPSVYNSSSRIIPDYGLIKARIIIDPSKIDEVKIAVEDICNDLITNGVTEEEMLRVKEPLLTALKDRLKTNKYWMRSVLQQSSQYPEQLQWPNSIFEDNSSVTAEEMSDYAAKYLTPSLSATVVIRPEE